MFKTLSGDGRKAQYQRELVQAVVAQGATPTSCARWERSLVISDRNGLRRSDRFKTPAHPGEAHTLGQPVRWGECAKSGKERSLAETFSGGRDRVCRLTATGMMRQASFKGLRKEKAAEEVVAEMPSPVESGTDIPDRKHASRVRSNQGGRRSGKKPPSSSTSPAVPVRSGLPVVMGVTLSSQTRYFGADAGDGKPVSKFDLASYYENVGNWMLPHLIGRPCSLVRAPDGISGEQFFQRHAVAAISNHFSLVKVKGDKALYMQIDRAEALAAVAQIGALEIHPWNCAPGNPEVAGRLVFDLDPAPDVAFKAVFSAALEIRERLKAVGLESFYETTGGKGCML